MAPNLGPDLEAGLGAPRRPRACPTCLVPTFILQDVAAPQPHVTFSRSQVGMLLKTCSGYFACFREVHPSAGLVGGLYPKHRSIRLFR